MRPIPPDLAARLVAEYLDGASSYALARRYGVGRNTVLRYVRRAGEVTRPPGRPQGPAPSSAALRLIYRRA